MFAATSLNAGFLVGSDNELVVFQCFALPLASV
jgi:hypothetical protein